MSIRKSRFCQDRENTKHGPDRDDLATWVKIKYEKCL